MLRAGAFRGFARQLPDSRARVTAGPARELRTNRGPDAGEAVVGQRRSRVRPVPECLHISAANVRECFGTETRDGAGDRPVASLR